MLNVLLSRTDRIGDVILTLPMTGLLKKLNPNIKIFFLGRTYTEDVVRCSEHVDVFINWDTLKNSMDPVSELKKYNIDTVIHVFPNKEFAKIAKKSGIPTRIGTNRRWFHFIYCNILVNLTRKKSPLHEALLNIRLLKPFQKNGVLKNTLTSDAILNGVQNSHQSLYQYYGFKKIKPLSQLHIAYKLIDAKKFNLIIHPKSGGSAQEWPLEKIIELVRLLPKEEFNIFFTGSEAESDAVQMLINKIRCNTMHVETTVNIRNVCGLFTLNEFISFIHACDGLIAASTGPLHISAALGKNTLGLYPSIQGMTAQRWGALGTHAQNFDLNCVTPNDVLQNVLSWNKHKTTGNKTHEGQSKI